METNSSERDWLTPEEYRIRRLAAEKEERLELKRIRDEYNKHQEELRKKEAAVRQTDSVPEIPVGVCPREADVSESGGDSDCFRSSEFSECEGTC